MEACRDKGGLERGEGVGVGVLCALEAAGTSSAIVVQPLLRCAGFMLKISNLLPRQLLGPNNPIRGVVLRVSPECQVSR